jgi:hypothetical protein
MGDEEHTRRPSSVPESVFIANPSSARNRHMGDEEQQPPLPVSVLVAVKNDALLPYT